MKILIILLAVTLSVSASSSTNDFIARFFGDMNFQYDNSEQITAFNFKGQG